MPDPETHHESHECAHADCDCFWCRVSRREHFETVTDVMAVAGPGHVVDVPVSASEPNRPKTGR